MNVRELSHDEYMAGLRCELQTDGLIEAVKKRLDEINQVTLLLNYEDWGVAQEKLSEIIDLLKMQEEPRLMTIDELFSINKTDSVVFVERRTKTYYNEMAFVNVEKVYKESVLFHGQKSIFSHKRKDYGKEWRCWTSRPTAEQMKSEPWGHICGPDYCEL